MTDDLTRQREAVAEARALLGVELGGLAHAARTAGNACQNKWSTPNLPHVYTAVTAVHRAEEALDLAELDLRTAAGEDI